MVLDGFSEPVHNGAGQTYERVLVTGAAGFVGYHTVRALLDAGVGEVVGIDCFLDNYEPHRKRRNVRDLADLPGFSFVGADLRNVDLEWLLDGVDGVIHLAALPGVRASWAEQFHLYAEHNIQVTQRLLEACRNRPISSFVYASSSSVYGNAPVFPTPEDAVTSPFSPYGVTKLAAEQLCILYGANHGVPVISLRYFTVYGPRQRPDMAIERLIEAALVPTTFPLYGSGDQVRDFTYVEDAARANVAALTTGAPPGTVLNVAGGSAATMVDVIEKVEELTGRPIRIERLETQSGDVHRTGGDVTSSLRVLGWRPTVRLEEGLRAQIDWVRSTHPRGSFVGV
jgi:UDP-glucuronate 4-epimerase